MKSRCEFGFAAFHHFIAQFRYAYIHSPLLLLRHVFVLSLQTVHRTLALSIQHLAALAAAVAAQDAGSKCARLFLSRSLSATSAAATVFSAASVPPVQPAATRVRSVRAAATTTPATTISAVTAPAPAACSEQPVARRQSLPSTATAAKIMRLQKEKVQRKYPSPSNECVRNPIHTIICNLYGPDCVQCQEIFCKMNAAEISDSFV